MASSSGVSSSGGTGGIDPQAAIADMKAAFDEAIVNGAKITEISTDGKTGVDAAKTRPNN